VNAHRPSLARRDIITHRPCCLIKEIRGLLDGIRLARGIVAKDQSHQAVLSTEHADRLKVGMIGFDPRQLSFSLPEDGNAHSVLGHPEAQVYR